MLYTIVPEEHIFGVQKSERYEEVQISNQVVQVVRANNSLIVNRLISTNPQCYLDKRFQPGRTIHQ